jgi:hypothetical protein
MSTSSLRGSYILIHRYHSHLLLSFHSETRLVEARRFSEYAEVPQAQFPGVVRDQATLAAANIVEKGDVGTSLAVQVTPAAVVLFDLQSGLEVDRWSATITLASVFGDTICVAMAGRRAAVLSVDTARSKLVAGYAFICIYVRQYADILLGHTKNSIRRYLRYPLNLSQSEIKYHLMFSLGSGRIIPSKYAISVT